METQDPISIQNQEATPDNANTITPEATSENDAPKLSAADIILQKLQAHKQESLAQIINEVSQEGVAASAGETEDETEGEDENEQAAETVEELDINYAELSKEGLIEALEKIVNREDVHKCKTYVDYIKTLFYKKIKAEVEQQREKFIENGYEPKDFHATPDPLEDKFKTLFDQYRDKRNKYNEQLEQQPEAQAGNRG